jgi:hypothetical protein
MIVGEGKLETLKKRDPFPSPLISLREVEETTGDWLTCRARRMWLEEMDRVQ